MWLHCMHESRMPRRKWSPRLPAAHAALLSPCRRHQCLAPLLQRSNQCALLISEENDDPIVVPEEHRGGYCVTFDPLDGSSNIDCGVSIGTIFGIYKARGGDVSDVLRVRNHLDNFQALLAEQGMASLGRQPGTHNAQVGRCMQLGHALHLRLLHSTPLDPAAVVSPCCALSRSRAGRWWRLGTACTAPPAAWCCRWARTCRASRWTRQWASLSSRRPRCRQHLTWPCLLLKCDSGRATVLLMQPSSAPDEVCQASQICRCKCRQWARSTRSMRAMRSTGMLRQKSAQLQAYETVLCCPVACNVVRHGHTEHAQIFVHAAESAAMWRSANSPGRDTRQNPFAMWAGAHD
jgi:Fructose-1-6-bisphosphatase, N-terminal domain